MVGIFVITSVTAVTIFRSLFTGEQIKNHNNLSMANRGFENPCEVIVKDHEGLVYLAVKTVSAQSMSSKNKMEGRIQEAAILI